LSSLVEVDKNLSSTVDGASSYLTQFGLDFADNFNVSISVAWMEAKCYWMLKTIHQLHFRINE